MRVFSERLQGIYPTISLAIRQNATAGNRTRVARVAGEHHTTRPQLLLDDRRVKSPVLILSDSEHEHEREPSSTTERKAHSRRSANVIVAARLSSFPVPGSRVLERKTDSFRFWVVIVRNEPPV